MCNSLWMWTTCLVLISCALKICHGPALSDEKRPELVCVIGAGYSGLAAARYLQQYRLNFVVFEATKHIGGTWRFDPHVGNDEDGVPVYSSMYKGLKTNGPRQTMEFGGFSMPEGTPSFPTGECFYNYIKSFANQFDLLKYIKFRSMVTSVSKVENHWSLTYTKTDSKTSHEVLCDFVVVANAQRHSVPNWPHFKGLEKFKGTKLHSHDYKYPNSFINRRVLVVGSGSSGLDLAVTLSEITSKLVHSHHRNLSLSVPKNYVGKPDIKFFTTDGAVFQDGSFEDIDDVIFCTGYLMDHSFLDKSTGVIAETKFVMPLYQYIVNIIHPTMAFVGLAGQAFQRTFDVQAEYVAALAAKLFKLPSQEDMMKSWLHQMSSTLETGKKIQHFNSILNGLNEYFESLSSEAGTPKPPPVLEEIREFNMNNRVEDWLHYRDYDFEIIDDNNYIRRHNPREKDDCLI